MPWQMEAIKKASQLILLAHFFYISLKSQMPLLFGEKFLLKGQMKNGICT